MAYRAFILLGAPGCGKGTQGSIIGSILGFLHLSSGDMFRGLDKESEVGKEALSYMTAGNLVPDDLTIRLFGSHLDGMVERGEFDPAKEVVVLDGIPRNENQAGTLAKSIDLLGVIHIDIADDQTIFERLKGRALTDGRPDDADPSVIQNRIEVYRRETEALLSLYPDGKILKIDGDQSVLKVHHDITVAIMNAVG